MKIIVIACLFFGVALAQHGGHSSAGNSMPPKIADLPNAREAAEIAKQHYKKNVEDAGRLLQIAAELKTDLDQQTASVVSAKTLKDAQEAKKLADAILKRLKSD